MAELSGDGAMTPFNRVRWLVINAVRNLTGTFARLPVETASADQATRALARRWQGSPSRLVSDMVLRRELGAALAGRPIRIVDVGCGTGGARSHFRDAGLEGDYLGVDVDDRFDRKTDWPGMVSRFAQGDAHKVELGEADLVFSFSALEHIPDDEHLITRLRRTLQPGGLQFHVVPAGWALVAYLWHGYRHYHRAALAARFTHPETRIIAIGGLGSLALHTWFIAVPEMLLRFSLRQRVPGLYGRLVAGALAVDRILPIFPTNYVVIEPAGEAS
ncbi:MAG: methyltransferase domain-containing protein [Alphaproteobacteria bacterium]|nr:methyltransferase domain-containing protein [Rhodospirillaceae bacterium]MDG2483072.1 methyltransferase domain-containing protein [Alphaproteobacteria bacterium]